MTSITSFSEENRFLSNFYPATVELDNMNYPSVEHAYQAAKTTSLNTRAAVQLARHPADAKRIGRRIILRQDWEKIKRLIMLDLVRKKFTLNQRLQRKLLATGLVELVEGNTWNDTYWGACRGVGENHLGKILMQVREEIRKKESRQ